MPTNLKLRLELGRPIGWAEGDANLVALSQSIDDVQNEVTKVTSSTPEYFGADPTGVTDSSAAFNLGWIAGKSLFGLPNAIYMVKDLIADGRRFYGNGCVLRPAPGARWMLKLKGYQPEACDIIIQDNANYTYETTLSSGVLFGATALPVLNPVGIEQGQVLFVDVDAAGSWFQTRVLSVVGSTVNVRDALPSAAATGKAVVALFGAVWVEDSAQYWKIDNIHVVNARGALLLAPTPGAISNKGSLTRFSTDGIYHFGVAKVGDAAGVKASDIKLWGGFVLQPTAVGNGTAGPFVFSTTQPAFLARDLTLTVNGTAKTTPTHWTFATDGKSINFTAGNFPAVGAAIAFTFYTHGKRGFVDDQRFTSLISGGNKYTTVETLGCYLGTHAQEAELSNYSGLVGDTCSYGAMQLDSCVSTLSVDDAFLGFSGNSIKAFNSSVSFGRLFTQRVPTGYLARPSITDDNIYADASSRLDINAGEWSGGDYQVNGPGVINWRNGRQLNFFSTPGTAVAAAQTVYLNINGHTSAIPANAQVLAADSNALEFAIENSAAPGAGQSFTYQLNLNGADVGPTVATTGAAAFSSTLRLTQATTKGDRVLLKLVTSATAVASEHRAVGVFR